jgi:beta-1,4-mannosyltransferase
MYQLSYTVILLQQDFISGVMKKISLPSYVVRLREGKQAVLAQFTFDTRLLVAVSGPLLLGIALFADPLLLIVLNESWMEALPVLRILCIETLRQSLLSLAAPALLALGKEAAMLRYSRLSAVILVASFTALSYTNLFIFVIGYFIINSVLNLYYFDITRKALGTRGQEIAAAMMPGLLGATATFLIWSLLVVLGANDALMISGLLPAMIAGFAVAAAVSGEIPRALRQMTAGIFGATGRRLPDTITIHTDAAFSDYNPHLKSLHLAIQEKDTRFVFFEVHFRDLLRSTCTRALRSSAHASRELLHLHFPALLYDGGSLPASVLRGAKYFLILSFLRLRGFTFLLTMHDDRAHAYDHRRFERFYLFLLVQSAEIVITLSQAGAEMLRDRFARDSGVFITPHPVYAPADIGSGENISRQRQEARKHFMLNEHDKVLLMFGTKASYKGYDNALETLKQLGAPISLICAGRGMASLPLESLPTDIRLILLDQRLDDVAAARCFLAADYCLLPYRHILHSGTAMLAATYSCPIIAPRTGVFRDIEAQHAIAVLYDAGEKSALADAIRAAIEIPRPTYAESFREFRNSHSREIARDTTIQAYYGLFETFSAHSPGS